MGGLSPPLPHNSWRGHCGEQTPASSSWGQPDQGEDDPSPPAAWLSEREPFGTLRSWVTARGEECPARREYLAPVPPHAGAAAAAAASGEKPSCSLPRRLGSGPAASFPPYLRPAAERDERRHLPPPPPLALPGRDHSAPSGGADRRRGGRGAHGPPFLPLGAAPRLAFPAPGGKREERCARTHTCPPAEGGEGATDRPAAPPPPTRARPGKKRRQALLLREPSFIQLLRSASFAT
ncbi:PREDICTED: U1 small nuclear ribonucleoprotein C-like [Gekko japonicus]|uniref:U1 small nuclear ribonucleoprotein C-like n=1 Tax=Gekko japonicus TaxID=146911 RepID=A0ABM1L2F0_GEKJA|nr:PREDICTED: U1 small nuclear ribonucleoprotein C-like [Gekko japonicus]